jgi:hypothetical protein
VRVAQYLWMYTNTSANKSSKKMMKEMILQNQQFHVGSTFFML